MSEPTIAALADIILECPYRTGPELIEFFARYGDRDLYGPGSVRGSTMPEAS